MSIERRRVAVIRRLENDHVSRAGVRARQAQRELVRLARRIHEIAHVELRAASSRAVARRIARAGRSDIAYSCSARASARRRLPRRADGSARRAARCCTRRRNAAPSSSYRYCFHPRTIFTGSRYAMLRLSPIDAAARRERLLPSSAAAREIARAAHARSGLDRDRVAIQAARCDGRATPGKSVPSPRRSVMICR